MTLSIAYAYGYVSCNLVVFFPSKKTPKSRLRTYALWCTNTDYSSPSSRFLVANFSYLSFSFTRYPWCKVFPFCLSGSASRPKAIVWIPCTDLDGPANESQCACTIVSGYVNICEWTYLLKLYVFYVEYESSCAHASFRFMDSTMMTTIITTGNASGRYVEPMLVHDARAVVVSARYIVYGLSVALILHHAIYTCIYVRRAYPTAPSLTCGCSTEAIMR